MYSKLFMHPTVSSTKTNVCRILKFLINRVLIDIQMFATTLEKTFLDKSLQSNETSWTPANFPSSLAV